MSLETLVMATDNAHKLQEVRRILGDRYRVVSQREAGFAGEVAEDGQTFGENALIKARAVFDALGCAVLADDSGLEVDALGGAPGVHSARYAGVHGRDDRNNEKLLADLAGLPPAARTARFVCAMVLVRPGQEPLLALGRWEGHIAPEARGENGFGYDPLFLLADGRSAAELSQDEKNAASHRGQALQALRRLLEGEVEAMG